MAKNSCRSRGTCGACTRCGRAPCTAWQGPRSIARLGRTVLTYRSCLRRTLAAAAALVILLSAGGISGQLLYGGAAAVVIALAWILTALRLMWLSPSYPGPGPAPPGGAGVREPRRPKPGPPGSAIALPLPPDAAARA